MSYIGLSARNDVRISTIGSANIDGSVIVNESSADKDFRVESDGNTHMLFVNGGNNCVGIGNASPTRALSTSSSSVTVGSFTSSSASGGMVSFVDPNTTNDYTVRVGSLGNNLVLQSGGSTAITLDSSQNATFAGSISATSASYSSTISLTDSDVTHGITGILPTGTYAQLTPEVASGTAGGLRITTATEGSTAYSVAATSTTPSTDGNGAVFRFRASKKDSTGEQALADADDLMTIGNVGAEKVTIKGNGDATFAGSVTANNIVASGSSTHTFNSGGTNVVASFTSTDGTGAIQLVDSGGNVELSAVGSTFQVQPSGGAAKLSVDASMSTFATDLRVHSGTNAALQINDNIGEVGAGNIALQAQNTAADALTPLGFRGEDIRFATGSAERMRLKSNGDLQIGSGNSHAPLIQGTTNDGRTPGSPGYSFNGDLDTGMYQTSGIANTISFSTAGSERIRIDATGMTGIGGNTDPNFLLHINKGTSSYNPTGDTETYFGINTSYDTGGSHGLYHSLMSGNWTQGIDTSTPALNTSWGTVWCYQNLTRAGIAYDHYGQERFQIWSAYGHITFSTYDTVSSTGIAHSSGMKKRLVVQTGGNVIFGENSTTAPTMYFAPDSGGGAFISKKDSTNSRRAFEFNNPNGTVGSIDISGSATAFNTSSDYRLKENVSYDWDATARLKQLKPARFNWKADQDNTVDGFLAHEVSSIVPEAINGEKDAMQDEQYEIEEAVKDDEGKITKEAVMGTRSVPVYQSIDQSKLVPLLVKTIQELEARIAKLEE